MTARPAPTHLRVEHHRDPIGVGEPRPRLSWTGSPEAAAQVAYEVHVRDAMSGQERTSGRIASSESVLVPWPFEGLPSRARREVRVRTWSVAGADGERAGDASPSPWSASVTLETGLLERADWLADLISPDWDDAPDVDHAPALLRRDFRLAGEVAAARLYATAHGLYEVEINGVRVGDDVLAPGWTSYRHRLRYRTHDVTALVRDGANAVGATLADGWFRGRFGFEGGVRNIYGERTALLAQLEVTYADGRVAMIGTDGSWRAATGPITVTGIYDGETYDARLDRPGWSAPGYDDGAWAGVRIEPAPSAALVAPTGPPVRRIEEVAPVEVITSPSGATILDFGQNLVGRLRIQVRGEAGTAVTLRHAEVLENGELGTRPLRQAAATDTYVMRGDPAGEEWEPRFTFHGFRYAEVDGWRGDLDPGDVRAVVVHTDMRRTGTFTTGDPLLDRLHENVVWGMRGNFIDIPTDCPQRDERLGWTGDIQVFAPTASYLYDCAGLLTSWLEDLALEQVDVGTVPIYVPYFRTGFPLAPLAAWGDAAVVVPWVLYQRTGDAGVLARQWASMTAWVDQVADLAGPDHLWDTGLQLGDWLDPAAPPDNPADARTDRHLVATAYHAWTAGLLAEAAEVLGRADDAARYAALAAAVRAAFRREYVSPSGRLVSDAPTAYALAICFDLLEPPQVARAGRRLVDLVVAGDHRIATGFVGTPIICDALSRVGAHDTAYQLVQQTECPSWLYPVTMGATTIWERWDSMLPDGAINPGDMTSFNHYALGAVADWMHRTIAGLAPTAPGYRRILVAPRPGGGLSHAATAHETPYGRAAVAWRRSDDVLTVDVAVPAGTTALLRLPGEGWEDVEVGPGAHTFRCAFRAPEDDPARPRLDLFGRVITD